MWVNFALAKDLNFRRNKKKRFLKKNENLIASNPCCLDLYHFSQGPNDFISFVEFYRLLGVSRFTVYSLPQARLGDVNDYNYNGNCHILPLTGLNASVNAGFYAQSYL